MPTYSPPPPLHLPHPPLSSPFQRDLPHETARLDIGSAWGLPEGLTVDAPSRDYTPPSCITLLFTDLGALTPSAVCDELVQLYL